MSSSNIGVNGPGSGSSAQSASSSVSSALSKDDFLKLLVAQLSNQDPTTPMDTGQFVSQMAQFTSLEQTQNMGSAIDKLVTSQTDLSARATMIGKEITWTQTNTDASGNNVSSLVSGIVNAVTVKDGAISYLTDKGDTVDPSMVTKIAEPAGSPGAAG